MFAVGLLAGNVPEGLLPVITLALAVAVSALARRGSLVKRLSAVETLGSTDVICTDKTGTLTENRIPPPAGWNLSQRHRRLRSACPPMKPLKVRPDSALTALAEVAIACNNAQLESDGQPSGDPTEVALLVTAKTLGLQLDASSRELRRSHQYNFDPQRKLMSTLDNGEGHDWLNTKGSSGGGAPAVHDVSSADGLERPMDSSLSDSM